MTKPLNDPTVERTVSAMCGISSTESVKGEVLQEAWPDLVCRDTGRFLENLATPAQRELQEIAAGTIRGLALRR